MGVKTMLKSWAARAAEAVARLAGDDDSELAKIAYDRAAKWTASAAGAQYDSTPIRDQAKKGSR